MRLRTVTGLALAGVLLAGCGGDDPATPEALPTVSPSAAPSPTAVTVPTGAQAETPQGAAQFARFFYAEVQRAFAEKDPAIVERLSAPGCNACTRFSDSIEDLRSGGGRVTEVRYDIKVAEAPETDGQTARVTIIYDSPAIQGFDSQGNVVREEPAVTGFEEQVDLARGPDGWLVQAVTIV